MKPRTSHPFLKTLRTSDNIFEKWSLTFVPYFWEGEVGGGGEAYFRYLLFDVFANE